MAIVESDFETSIKIIVVGNGGVGKSSMIRRFCTGQFTSDYKKTLGVDFMEKQQYLSSLSQNVRLMLWDTAGQEEFDTITRHYYRGAGGCVLVFATDNRDSFRDVDKWRAKVEEQCGPLPMALVQNKMDLLDEAAITSEEAEALAKRLRLRFFRTCVREGLNVDNVFEYLAEKCLTDASTPKDSSSGPAAQQSASAGGGGGGGGGGASSSASSSSAAAKPQDANPSFQLSDSKPKQRTGGKKSFKCSLG